MTDLDSAMDKLLSAREHRMPALMELSQLLFVGVARERGFVAGLAKKHSGWQLSRAMLAVYHMHRSLSEHGNGLVRWDSALAKELNGKLEETTAPKEKLTQDQEDVIQGLMRMGKKRTDVEELVLSIPHGRGVGELMLATMSKLDERKAR